MIFFKVLPPALATCKKSIFVSSESIRKFLAVGYPVELHEFRPSNILFENNSNFKFGHKAN